MRRLFLRAAVASFLLLPSLAYAGDGYAGDRDDEDEDKSEEASDEESGDDDDSEDSGDDDGTGDDKSGDDKSGDDKSGDDKSGDDKSGDDKSGDADDDDGESKKRKWGHGGKVATAPNPKAMSGEYRWDVHLLEFVTFSVGFLGGAGGTFLDKPGDQSVQGFENVDPEYPGFAGLTTGIGPSFEVRFLGFVGVELDVLFQSDTSQADLKVSQTVNSTTRSEKFSIEITQSATHVPLLFKGSIPGRIVTPMLFLGPEFVFVNESSSKIIEGAVPGFHNVDYSAKNPDSYVAFMFGFGFEFNLPIPYVDLRIPFMLRGMVNPGLSDEREGRADYGGNAPDNITSVAFSTEYKFQATGHLGLAAHF